MAPGGGALPGDPSADANRMVRPLLHGLGASRFLWFLWFRWPRDVISHTGSCKPRVAGHPSLLNVLSLKPFQTTQTQPEAGACVSSLLNSTLILVQCTDMAFLVVSLCFLFLFKSFCESSNVFRKVVITFSPVLLL